MSKDTERRTLITAINAKIDVFKARLIKIPGEIEQLEKARKEILVQSVERSKQLHEAGDLKKSKEATNTARLELCGINRNIDERHREQASIAANIAKLEKERTKLLM